MHNITSVGFDSLAALLLLPFKLTPGIGSHLFHDGAVSVASIGLCLCLHELLLHQAHCHVQTVDFRTHLLDRGGDGGLGVVKRDRNRNSRGRVF